MTRRVLTSDTYVSFTRTAGFALFRSELSVLGTNIDSVITADAWRQFGLLPGEQVDRRITERAYTLIYGFLFVRLLYEAVSAADM